jgi:phosphoribosylformylglycinamidine cyclo-ligase
MSRYKALGVDVRKEGIAAFKGVVDDLFPGAFCVVTRDPTAPERGLVSHADSAGSKPILSYICYKESGDPAWFKGLAQDAVAMNVDDVVCVAAEPVAFIDYIAFNTLHIDRVEMLGALSEGFDECFQMLHEHGMPVLFGGGETADLPDQMRTLDVCGALFGHVYLGKVVTGYEISPGDVIVGLKSGGSISYEDGSNSGIMCNGLTLARNSLMSSEYLKVYPEAAHPGKGRFTGRFRYDDQPDGLGMTVGEALTSPTRIFAPIANAVLEKIGEAVHGMVHNTGGGQTKCLSLGRNIRYIKDSLVEPDPIFGLLQREARVEWREMYEDFNMGVGFEFIVEPQAVEEVVRAAEGFGIGVQVVGRCERGDQGNSLVIESEHGKFSYTPA